MPKSDLRLDILGTSFSITADEESDYLEKILASYRESIESIQAQTGLKDPLKVAILTGFLLSDEIEKLKLQNKDGEAEQLTLNLISRLDKVLDNKIERP
jgi:cell division protein ZapA (FtsZ GTPase activity inhibitor)